MPSSVPIQSPLSEIKLLLSDIDGVLTDGKLIYGSDGREHKEFHVRDGLAVKIWRSTGRKFGLVTARQSESVEKRANELSVDFLYQACPRKLETVRKIAAEEAVELSEICYVGDDLHDLSAIQAVGVGVAVNDGAAEVVEAANIVLDNSGGQGALRELVEFILKSNGEWQQAIQKFSL